MPLNVKRKMLQTFKRRITKRFKACLVLLLILVLVVLIVNPFKGRGYSKFKIQKNLNKFAFYLIIDPMKYLCKNKSKILFVVPSRPAAYEARSALRKTWGNPENLRESNSTMVFLIGKEEKFNVQKLIFEESEKHKDILQANFIDSYFNLTLKSVIMLRWVATSCSDIDYLMKVDDDIYIYYENLLRYLSTFFVEGDGSVGGGGGRGGVGREKTGKGGTEERGGGGGGGEGKGGDTIVGHLVTSAKPIRDKNHKWFISREEYAADVYPDYILGGCYLIAGGLITDLYAESQRTPLIRFEDLYLTGILASKTNAKLVHNEDFNGKVSFRCRHRTKILDHGFTPMEMIEFHQQMTNRAIDKKCKGNFFDNLLTGIG